MHQSDEYYQDRIAELECRVGELEEELDTARAERVSAEAEVERLQGLREELERERKAAGAMRDGLEDISLKLRRFPSCYSFPAEASEACCALERTAHDVISITTNTDAGRGYVRVEERDALQAQVAQLREALEAQFTLCSSCHRGEPCPAVCVCSCASCHAEGIKRSALSAPAPRIITAEEMRPLVDRLKDVKGYFEAIRAQVADIGEYTAVNAKINSLEESLAHAKAKGWL